jgi:hypothetical protein
MKASDIIDELKTFYKDGVEYRSLDRHMVVNDLSTPVTNTSGPRPLVFWEVYWAFDEGEHYHGDNRDEDTVEVYTRPMIARIVAVLGTSR